MKGKTILAYIKQHRKIMLLFVLLGGIFSLIGFLYGVPADGILYAWLLCAAAGAVWMALELLRYQRKHEQLEEAAVKVTLGPLELPEAANLIEEDYQQILQNLWTDRMEQVSEGDRRQSEMLDYYTMWVHQIKTPIAALHLLMQEETPENQQRLVQLFKIEQYVEMVLSYLRLGSESRDLVLAHHNLAELVRGSVRKYAALFIQSHLRLELGDLDVSVLTDEKWFCFALEQILSNALKYTPSGSIRISLEPEKTLVIRDTGIGIAPEDLPRIGEKGFTGYNGRSDKKATGLGLYLCKQSLGRLGHRLQIDSVIGEGTTVRIDLSQRQLDVRD